MTSIRTTLAFVSLAIIASGCVGSKLPERRTTWMYEISVTNGLDLDVSALLPPHVELVVDEEAMPFVSIVSREGERVRYHVRLREMADTVRDPDTAAEEGGAIFAPPSSWLLHPVVAGDAMYAFEVQTPEGIRFATGVRGEDGHYLAPASKLAESTFAAFGALRTKTITPGFDVAIAPKLPLSDEAVVGWWRDGLDAIRGYFGRVPDGRATFFVGPSAKGPTRAKTIGEGGAAVLVHLGPETTNENLQNDWVATHELVHVGFPRLAPKHAWFAEGLATYVEPIARARIGKLAPDAVWKDVAENLPRGRKPIPLEGAMDWDRVYWGGALYFLLVDLHIREKTNDRKSLVDAVRAVVATGANVETELSLEAVIGVADRATGTHAFRDTIAEVDTVDIAALCARLGISKDAIDEHAPDAARRRAITSRP